MMAILKKLTLYGFILFSSFFLFLVLDVIFANKETHFFVKNDTSISYDIFAIIRASDTNHVYIEPIFDGNSLIKSNESSFGSFKEDSPLVGNGAWCMSLKLVSGTKEWKVNCPTEGAKVILSSLIN
jgi:hypothetical protein